VATPIDDGGPAFPVADLVYPNGQVELGSGGMTLRAYFAGQAVAGLMANTDYEAVFDPDDAAEVAYHSLKVADALIAQLKGKGDE
jgi:hypothetical protein